MSRPSLLIILKKQSFHVLFIGNSSYQALNQQILHFKVIVFN